MSSREDGGERRGSKGARPGHRGVFCEGEQRNKTTAEGGLVRSAVIKVGEVTARSCSDQN